MMTNINMQLFIYNLTVYMLNTVNGIKEANKETQERWISEIQHYVHSDYLDLSFNKLYPNSINSKGVDVSVVWNDIIKADKWKGIAILSDIDEISKDIKEDIQEKALVYLMNAFVGKNSIEFNLFQN